MTSRKQHCHRRFQHFLGKKLLRTTSGVAMVEFAIILPILLLLLFGILTYGSYYYTAHTVQQLANDGARSTLAGMTATERKTLAKNAVLQAATGAVNVDRLAIDTTDNDPFVRVSVRYDASDSPLFKINVVPLPDPVIRRTAAVRMGGL